MFKRNVRSIRLYLGWLNTSAYIFCQVSKFAGFPPFRNRPQFRIHEAVREKAKDLLRQPEAFEVFAVVGGAVREFVGDGVAGLEGVRSEEHTSELQSRENLVCRLLLEKKKKRKAERKR